MDREQDSEAREELEDKLAGDALRTIEREEERGTERADHDPDEARERREAPTPAVEEKPTR